MSFLPEALVPEQLRLILSSESTLQIQSLAFTLLPTVSFAVVGNGVFF
jgi:hypothetical protein